MSRKVDRAILGFERINGTSVGSSSPQPGENGLAGWTFDPAVVQAGTIVPTAGRLELARVRASGSLVTNILLAVTAAGVTLTAGRNLAGLFTDAGALLGTSVDQSTAWQSTGLITCALTAPQAVTPGAYYRVGFFATGTTLPTFARASVAVSGAALNPGQSAPTLRFSTADTGLTTALPGTIGAQTAAATAWWLALQ